MKMMDIYEAVAFGIVYVVLLLGSIITVHSAYVDSRKKEKRSNFMQCLSEHELGMAFIVSLGVITFAVLVIVIACVVTDWLLC